MGTGVLSCLMLAVGLYGYPPEGYYDLLKWMVAGSCVLLAVVAWQTKRLFAPLGLVLLLLAVASLMSHTMHRHEWDVFAGFTIFFLLVTCSLLLLIIRLSRAEDSGVENS